MIGQLERIIELRDKKKGNSNSSTGKIITISSGKGGTGKTFVSTNLAFYLSQLHKKILLIDLDFNMGNVSTLLNLYSEKSLVDFLLGKSLFNDVIHNYSNFLSVIPGDSGSLEYPNLTNEVINRLKLNISKLLESYDYIIIDSASGIEKHNIELANFSDLSLIIATPEPTSVMDAYAFIKILDSYSFEPEISVVINKCIKPDDSNVTFENLFQAVNTFLNREIKFAGSISFSTDIHMSIVNQKILLKSKNPSQSETFKKEISIISEELMKFIQVDNNNH